MGAIRKKLMPKRKKTKGTLYTSYFAKIADSGSMWKFSITLYPPKWLTKGKAYKENLYGLAPSYGTFSNYKNGNIDDKEFEVEYNRQLRTSRDAKDELAKITEMLEDGYDVVLYCYEKPPKFCHRHLVGKYFSELGYNVKEI